MSSPRQLALLWAAVAAALVAISPLGGRLATALPACPIRAWLDLPCLTCGSTRAALALAQLDLGAAFAANPLAALLWIGLVGGGAVAGALAASGRALPEWQLRPTLALRLAAVAVLAANWAYLIRAGV